ncbi:MAG: hypothetical protein JXR85_06950 [Deltaproteobacteria bacterium]|nr:hypothetical protein [Deltaproteobacteria bacterium]
MPFLDPDEEGALTDTKRKEDILDILSSAFNTVKGRFPDYEDRSEQWDMAREIFRCLTDGKRLLIEAGTGVGKSFAYLIPALFTGEKTIVSTSSLALQDQLITKDLVFLEESFPGKFSFAVLKGRNNYLCLKKYAEYVGTGKSYTRFRSWAAKTSTGEKSELSFVPSFWADVCGDSRDCSGKLCSFFGTCFYYRHYRKLSKTDILVVNHHLLIYDLISEFNILPFHESLIIDEASDIEEIISTVFGSGLSYSRTTWLLSRLRGCNIVVDNLVPEVESFFKTTALTPQAISPIPVHITERLRHFKEKLSLSTTRATLEKLMETATDDELKARMDTTAGYLQSFESDVDDFISQDDPDRVFYVSANSAMMELKSCLVESQEAFRQLTEAYGSVIMTSATLTSGGTFSFIKQRLGIGDFEERVIGSPFDYRNKSLLYVDADLPPPNRGKDDVFQQESLGVIEGLIEASRGRALVLFTSYRHLNYVAENVSLPFPFRSQGEAPPAKLVQWFRDTPHSVLFAAATFWQGIDIKGDDLSLVVICRLPFNPPGDPVYQERCRRLGQRWFYDLALPSAIMSLRQGFGRLIRGSNDYGVVAILDSRVVKSSYGKTILSSLPEIPVTHGIDDVKRFFDALPAPSVEKETAPLFRGSKGTGKKRLRRTGGKGRSTPDPAMISELIVATKSANGNERRLAASALGKLAGCRPAIYEAVESLEGLLADEKPQVRQYALIALEKIGAVNEVSMNRIANDPDEKGYNIVIARRLLETIS